MKNNKNNWINLLIIGLISILIPTLSFSASQIFTSQIHDDAVSYAKIQNISTNNRLLGRATAGAGDTEEITLGTNLSFTGTTLNATGGGGVSDGDKGDITVTGSGATWTIDQNVVTYSQMQNMTTARILGRTTAATGDIEELTAGNGIDLSSGSLAAKVQMSVTSDASGLKLSGDATSPGNDKSYGTNASGTKGYYDSVPDVQIFTSTGAGTWTKPTGFTPKIVKVVCIGAGGGGGGGAIATSTNRRKGGAGGGGGTYIEKIFTASDLAATENLSVGAGGTSGAGGVSTNADGSDGGVGGNSTFGTTVVLTAYGGGGGKGGTRAIEATGGGGGGGTGSAGSTGTTAGGTGGSPGTSSLTAIGGTGAIGGASTNNGGLAEYGGGGGGGSSSAPAAGEPGGSSIFGGGGGGQGGGVNNSPAVVNPGAGGNSNSYVAGGGGAAGTSGASPTAGTAGTAGTSKKSGTGGGGGGSSATANTAGANGGDGGAGGGGAGGGGAGTNTSNGGAGGTGGRGEIRVYTW